MSRYRKFFVVLVGIAIGVVGRRYGIDSQVYIDIVAGATALGVYAVPNAE